MNKSISLTSRLFLLYKLTRPTLPLLSGLAVWIIAQSCQAAPEQALAAAMSMALGTIGASFYHYGGANWMYARKSERFKFKDPEIVRLIGLALFSVSICIASIWLSKTCVLICVFNTFIIAAYSAKLSSHWTTKNIAMSIVCVTPILMGWQAGSVTHPLIAWSIAVAAVAYFSREIIKDVKDILANEGKRVTLPMILGKEQALQISGGLLIIAAILLFGVLQFTKGTFQTTMGGAAVLTLLTTGTILLVKKRAGRCETLIELSIGFILLALW